MAEIQEPDPLDLVKQLIPEIRSHQKRLLALRASLPTDPQQANQVLANELCDTVMSLFADFAALSANALDDERDYIMSEIVPELFDDEEPGEGEPGEDDDEEDDSILTMDDSAEFAELLSGYESMLAIGLQNLGPDAPDEAREEVQSMIDRVRKAQARIIEITEEDDVPETPSETPQ